MDSILQSQSPVVLRGPSDFNTLYPIYSTLLRCFSQQTNEENFPMPSLLSLYSYSFVPSVALRTTADNDRRTNSDLKLMIHNHRFRLLDGSSTLPRSILSSDLTVSTGRGTKMKNPRFHPPSKPKKKLKISYSNLKASVDGGTKSITEGVRAAGADGGEFVNLNSERLLKWYSGRFRDCAASACLNEGKAIHGKMIKNGINPDTHLFVSIINFYAKCGALNFARKAFDKMPEKDVVSWTALISGFVAEGRGSEGVELFCEMRREGVRHNEFTLATMMKGCSLSSDLEFAKQLHTEVVKGGAFSDVYVGSSLVDLYAKCGELEYAEKVFFVMPDQNAVSWNALLNGYAQMGDGYKVLTLFCEMMKSEMRFSNYTMSSVLKGCASSRSLEAGQVVHSMAIKLGGEYDDFVCCSLVDMYSKCELVNDALDIFRRIKNPDIVTWCTMISGLDQQGQKVEALNMFRLMMLSGLRPNQFSLSNILSAAADLGDLQFCRSIHACICKYCFESDLLVGNALISTYMKLGFVYEGFRVFSALSQRDVVSWNALLSGFHVDESSDEAPIIFKNILMENLRPNKYTFISILRNCASQSNAKFGKQVHAHILKSSLDTDDYVGNALIDMYSKCRCFDDAECVFNRLTERDTFGWTVIIAGYANSEHQVEKAMECFNQMQREGVEPNEFTLGSCLKACSSVANLDHGRQLHSWAIKSGQSFDVCVASALVDMYGKCGCIDDAENIFNSTEVVDTVMWNTMICGHSLHGQNEQALQSFKRMLHEDVRPDGVTFIGILSACSHMGLVDEGRRHFQSMTEMYGIIPSIDHCACMVDILGRAGRFSEVESFIEHMKITPNTLIWQTVLGACKLHGNVELGEKAAHKLHEMEPNEDGHYILLSNIYAAKGRWDDVSRIRGLMSSQGVKKEPGCSWVEVDAQTHVFLSQDASHPRSSDIYRKLGDLYGKLCLTGYVPNINHALHNVPDAEKKANLFHHSERLALSFALVNNLPSRRIRIFKNLRICGDCHEFMKGVSDITQKEIVIRDIRRFHHFRNGMCSCKDCW